MRDRPEFHRWQSRSRGGHRRKVRSAVRRAASRTFLQVLLGVLITSGALVLCLSNLHNLLVMVPYTGR